MKGFELVNARVAELEARRDLWKALASAVQALVALAQKAAGEAK